MPPRPSRTVPTVVVPGWEGSGPDHWQTWLEAELRAAGRETTRIAVDDWDHPVFADWLAALRGAMAPLPDLGYDVVAHSLGAVLWLHHTVTLTDPHPRPARVALVGLPSLDVAVPEVAEFLPPPIDRDAVVAAADGTVLVGTDNDEWCPEGMGAVYGRPLGLATTVVPGGGHLNVEAGFGEWPAMLAWCGRDKLAFY